MTWGNGIEKFDRALVVFSGRADLWWLRLLRRGFRHCFVALEGREEWLVVDPLSHQTVLARVPKMQEFCLESWYRANGLKVVNVEICTAEKRVMPIMAYSCVECVKRILGIRARWVVTPWQLHRHLNKTGNFSLTSADV